MEISGFEVVRITKEMTYHKAPFAFLRKEHSKLAGKATMYAVRFRCGKHKGMAIIVFSNKIRRSVSFTVNELCRTFVEYWIARNPIKEESRIIT